MNAEEGENNIELASKTANLPDEDNDFTVGIGSQHAGALGSGLF